MGKKRKCRMNEEEIRIHEMAIKLRKKTDEQLVTDYFEQYQKGIEEGGFGEDEIRMLSDIGVQMVSKAGKRKTVPQIIRELVSIIARNKQRRPDGFFKSTGAKEKFLEVAKATPGIGGATYQKIERLVNGNE